MRSTTARIAGESATMVAPVARATWADRARSKALPEPPLLGDRLHHAAGELLGVEGLADEVDRPVAMRADDVAGSRRTPS